MAEQSLAPFVLFPKKDNPSPSRSELIFLDENGLAVAIAEAGVDFRNGRYQSKPVSLVAHDPVSRLTLLRVPLSLGNQTRPVELGSSLNLPRGSELYSGVEGEARLSRLVSRESQYKESPLPLELIRIHHGLGVEPVLGLPLFDSAGRLVAINYRSTNEFGNGSLAFPVEALRRIQGATVVDGIVQRSWFGVELLPSDPFAVVQGILPDSPASKAKIEKGDILIQIGPRKIKGYSDAIDAFFYLRESEVAVVKLLRGTELLELNVSPALVPAVAPALEPKNSTSISTEESVEGSSR